MRGVNLGGWLVLERWITPSVFKGVMAEDEYGLCRELGEKKTDRLEEHRKTFITEDDFVWIKAKGLDAVRIPVPHWVFGGFDPYVECSAYVDWAFEQAEKHGLKILLDLHTAPGSQNGNVHSGRIGAVGWHTDSQHIEQTLDVLDKLAERYGQKPELLGIELLNEPAHKVPKTKLLEYYSAAQERVRRHTEQPVIISDAFQPEAWQDEMTDMWLDMHMYQIFSKEDASRPIHKVIKKARYEWAEQLNAVKVKRQVIVGEWSLAFGKSASRGLDDYERDKAKQAYAGAQLLAYENADAWFYWTYKTEDAGSWNFRECVKRGWIHL